MRSRLGLLGFLLLAGCGGGVSVGDLQQSAIHQVTYSDHPGEDEDAYPVRDYVRLRLDLVRADDRCAPIASSVKASLNGRPMRFLEGVKQEGMFESSCVPAFFDLHVRREELPEQPQNAVIELSDGNTRTLIEVQGLLARRGLVPEPETLDEVRVGQDETFRWHPATDIFVPGNLNRGISFIAVRAPDGRAGNWEAAVDDRDAPGMGLVLSIPDTAPVGPGVVIWGGRVSPPVLRCEGPKRCEAIGGVEREVSLAIQPAI
jgi:hypothetical protein